MRSAPSTGEVLLVDPRVLRRVIKRHRRLPGIGLDVPHAFSYAIGRAALLDIVEADELGRSASAIPEDVILLPREGDEAKGGAVALRRRWRGTFHARVHLALERKLQAGELTMAAIRERIHRLGQCEFDEARTSLRQSRHLVDPRDDRETWAEFAATYVELRTFAPAVVTRMFPTLEDLERIDALVAEDVDGSALVAATRPPGATLASAVEAPVATASASRPVLDLVARDLLLEQAAAARSRGNHVRAALSYLAAASAEGHEEAAAEVHASAARVELDALATSLDRALGAVSDARGRAAWTDALVSLASRSIRGARTETTVEARALFDVQNACREAERTPKTVELAAFVRSLGKKPIVRELPAAREIRVARRLRSAEVRAARARLPQAERRRVAELFHGVRIRAAAACRSALRPRVEEALVSVGLAPKNAVERAALHAIVEKLLDHAETRGSFGIGQVRDAISRSALKLPNLDLGQVARGDALLRADRRLGGVADGVYHEGEIYLRALQRVSSVAFGTKLGRLVTLHLALPFGAAFIALEGLSHLIHAVGSRIGLPEIHLVTIPVFIGVGVLLYLLLHVALARTVARRAASGVASAGYTVLVKAPLWVAANVGLVKLVKSRPFRLAMRFVLVPGAVAAAGWLLAHFVGHAPLVSAIALTAVVFAGVNVLTNSRMGLVAEEVAIDWIVRHVRWLHHHFIPGIYRAIVDFFALVLERVERAIYTVDEFFRFRQGENRAVLVAKVVLGFVWFFVAYVIRLYTNLLIEPQVNPIKHFPVVTVSHKLILPFVTEMMHTANAWLTPAFGAAGANAIVAPTMLLLPGVFGFIAWELKENFRLYAQNRPKKLAPVIIGSHGETMAALLIPGLHSGTVPKLYAKLRRATIKGDGSAGKHEDAIHEVRDAIGRFVEREIVGLLEESATWRFGAVRLDHVDLAASRVRVALKLAGSPEPLVLSFEEQSGLLCAGVAQPGFADELDEAGRLVLENLLAGVYRLAECDLVREAIQHEVGDAAYDIADEGLVVWPGPGYRAEVVYSLARAGVVTPTYRGEPPEKLSTALDTRRVLLREQPLSFADWCLAWETANPARLTSGAPLLPRRTKVATAAA